MLKNYELLYILHPDLEGSSDKITEKVTGFITKAEGEVTNHEDWGKRKLAYRIAKNDFGVYVLINFTLPSVNLPSVENDLRLSEEIMRFMIVVLPEEVEIKSQKKPKAVKGETKADEKPKAKKEVAPEVAEEPVVEEVKAEKPKAVKAKKTETAEKKTTKKAEKPADDEERLKKLDEKLEEILGE